MKGLRPEFELHGSLFALHTQLTHITWWELYPIVLHVPHMKQFYNVELFTSAAAQNPSGLGAVWSFDFWPADGQPAVFQSYK